MPSSPKLVPVSEPLPLSTDPRMSSDIRAEQIKPSSVGASEIEDILGDQRQHVELRADTGVLLSAMIEWD